jgi:hypothetical protein
MILNRIHVTFIDKDSNRSFTGTLVIDEELKAQYDELDSECPFRRCYVEATSDHEPNEVEWTYIDEVDDLSLVLAEEWAQ